MKRFRWLLVGLILLIAVGCQVRTNPDTGKKELRVDPNAAAKFEAGAEVTQTVLQALSPFLGEAGFLAGGLLAGALGVWRKMKPQVTEYKEEKEQYYAVASTTVTALDTLKEVSPEQWAVIKPKVEEELKKHGIKVEVLENVIRGLRGLPAKA